MPVAAPGARESSAPPCGRGAVTGRRLALRAAIAAAWATSTVARAQSRATRARIGYLAPRVARSALEDAFVQGLAQLGRREGTDIDIVYRWAGNDPARLRAMADELARLKVDVIVTATTAGTRSAMQATTTIPIVMAASADPVAAGLVASLGRPGGNVTGVSLQTTDVARKRLQQLREIVPAASRMALLAERVANASLGTTELLVAETRSAARESGLELTVREIASARELDEAFAQFRRDGIGAMIVQVGPLTLELRSTIIALAVRERIPALYEARNFVDDGGLASYGPDLRDGYRLAAEYVDRILRGAKAGDLPVRQPERLALCVNLRAAQAIGLDIPPTVLLRADEVLR